jgi:hypothetical protein
MLIPVLLFLRYSRRLVPVALPFLTSQARSGSGTRHGVPSGAVTAEWLATPALAGPFNLPGCAGSQQFQPDLARCDRVTGQVFLLQDNDGPVRGGLKNRQRFQPARFRSARATGGQFRCKRPRRGCPGGPGFVGAGFEVSIPASKQQVPAEYGEYGDEGYASRQADHQTDRLAPGQGYRMPPILFAGELKLPAQSESPLGSGLKTSSQPRRGSFQFMPIG